MTTTPAGNTSQSQPSLPNQPFFSWLRTHTTLFVGQIIGLLSVVSVPIALIYYSFHGLPLPQITVVMVGHFIIYAHLLFLVVFIGFLIRGLDKNNIGRYRATLVHGKLKGAGQEADREELNKLETYSTRQVGRFKRRFLGFWCSMLLLYLTFAFEPVFSVPVQDCLKALTRNDMFRTELFPILSFALNNVSLIFIFWSFSVLYIPSEDAKFPPKKWSPLRRLASSGPIRRLVGSRSIRRIVSSKPINYVLSLEFIRRIEKKLRGTDVDESERLQRTLVRTFSIVIALLTLTFPLIMVRKIGVGTNWSEYPAVFYALSGTINAIVLALLVARLDSKLIGLPSWLICVLYFYAGVQPMFVVFELHPEVYAGIKTAVLLVVFIFKIYFFLIIFYSLQEGRMFNYFFCSKVLNDHIKTLRQLSPTGRAPNAWAGWVKRIRSAVTSFFAGPKGPGTAVEKEKVIHSSDGSSERPTTELERDGQGTQVTLEWRPEWLNRMRGAATKFLSPPEEDVRAIWFQRVGVVAILFFAGSLLLYVSLSEGRKQWVDESRLSAGVIYFHVVLLFVILIVIGGLFLRDWIREPKSGSMPSDEARFRAPSELILKLSESLSPAEAEQKISDLSGRTRKQVKSFTLYFRLFWISLLSLYLLMCFSPSEKQRPSELCPDGTKADFSRGPVPEAKAGFWEPGQAESQADHTSETPQMDKGELSSDSQWPEQRLSIDKMPGNVRYAFGFFVINNFSVLVLFWCFSVLYIRNDDEKFDEKHRLLRNYSILIGVLLTILAPLLAIIIKGNGFTETEINKIPTILGAVGGTLNAVAFALLIARLDSRIIRLRLPLVVVLYAYAALQPLFVTFNQPSNLLKFIATSAMVAAFLFKICLVLMVGHVRNSGGLIDYLWFFPVVSKSVNSVFGNQFEIKSHSPKLGSFTFSISNKNVETYRAVRIYPTREKYDLAIKMLLDAMKKRQSYRKPPEEQGTWWVQVFDSDDALICESTSLRTEEEADELINESYAKVAYCKYDRG